MKKDIRVLLVDDEKQFVGNMKKILTARGFDATGAFSGRDAVDAIKYGGGFDVVVLDLKMPGMDGIETLGEIKKWAPDTEVIMLTGHVTLSSGTEAMRRGAYDFLMKPCDIEDLIEKICEAHETESIRRHPVLWPRKMVREIPLQDFMKLDAHDPIQRAVELMSRQSGEPAVEEIYVLDPEGRILGVVSKRDLLNVAQRAHNDHTITWPELLGNSRLLPSTTMGKIMRQDPITTQSNAFLTDAANQMFMNNVRCLPVIRAGKMIGMVRMQDIFQYLDSEIEE